MKASLAKLRLLTVAVATVVFADVAESGAPPNIVFILADDLGAAALGTYGNRDVATPNLDRLAADGITFTQAYADSQCTPSRAAILSGQYGARTGVFSVLAEQPLPRSYMRTPVGRELTPEIGDLARLLKSGGYATGLSGKWHVAAATATNGILSDPNRGAAYFADWGFDYAGYARDPEQDKSVTSITDELSNFIERHRAQPFFAYLMHFTPHTRLEAPGDLIETYAAAGYVRSTAPGCRVAERPTAEYLAMVEHLDASVGRIVAKLDSLGLGDDTVVVVSGDNGALSRCASSAPLREGKGSPYEGGIRVPLIVRWPAQVPAGSTSHTPVHFVDLYPTFAEIARVRVSDGRRLDGKSLLPELRRTGTLPWRSLFWHMPTYATAFGRTPVSVIRQGDWKLIHWFGDRLETAGFSPDVNPYGQLELGTRTELYDLRRDPSETTDLFQAEPERAARLKSILEQWWQRTGAPLPTRSDTFDVRNWWQ